MPALNWFIDKDHFAADTEFGRYEVGDRGNGLALVTFPYPGVGSDKVPFAKGKDRAQSDYDARCLLSTSQMGAAA